MASALAVVRAEAVKRLMRDFKEVCANPLLNVVAVPEESNVFVWHANVRSGQDSVLEASAIHLIIHFADNYPMQPPEVIVLTPLPHPNITRTTNDGHPSWRLALWDCMPGVDSWTSAYSVQSILLQLQVFLLKDDLQYDTGKVSISRAVTQAQQAACPSCSHEGSHPFPAFHPPQHLSASTRGIHKKVVSLPVPTLINFSLSPAHPTPTLTPFLWSHVQTLGRKVDGGWSTVVKKSRAVGNDAQRSDRHVQVAAPGNQLKELGGGGGVTGGTMWSALNDVDGDVDADVSMPSSMSPKEEMVGAAREGMWAGIEGGGAGSAAGYMEKEGSTMDEGMGMFAVLPAEAVGEILTHLALTDLGAISKSCRGLRVAAQDGAIWRNLMHRHYPATSLRAATLEDWKHAFLLEQSCALEDLRCFHTRACMEEDILGMPLRFTRNPKTGNVDYIEVAFDLISETAFTSLHVRNPPDSKGLPFSLYLPLYITQSHFLKALPRIQSTLLALCPSPSFPPGRPSPSRPSPIFHPHMVLQVLPTILNTMAVLLSDKGVAACDRALDGYCSLHRLFLALCHHFHLWEEVESRIARFLSHDSFRSKQACPNLGHFLALLSVATLPSSSWTAVARPLMGEAFDRSVMWACKHSPGLHLLLQKPTPQHPAIDPSLLSGWLKGSRVSMRLLCYHSAFLNLLARPRGVSVTQVAAGYDALYGRASGATKLQFKKYTNAAVGLQSFSHFYQMVGLKDVGPTATSAWLKLSWHNSLRKGYHAPNTRFDLIHRSGVSAILSRGETYRVAPNCREVRMVEQWRYNSGAGVQYLDASCLAYDFEGGLLETVDYSQTRSFRDAIVHSGDVIDQMQAKGEHTITVHLRRLPVGCGELWFTMSGWMGVTLTQIRLPFVRLSDAGNDTELCEYHFEDKSTGNNTCVIMCRLYRQDARARWEVEAVGHVGLGSASNYGPIHAYIKERHALRKGMREGGKVLGTS